MEQLPQSLKLSPNQPMTIQETIEAPKKWKRGQTREDGLVFLEYSKIHKGGERWVTSEKLHEIRSRKRLAKKQFNQKNRNEILKLRREQYKSDAKFRETLKQRSRDRYKTLVLTECQRLERNRKVALRRNSCPVRLLKHRVRCYLAKIMAGSGKPARTQSLLGCSFDEFKIHIENTFDIGMTWENRHLWHVDHIIPLASARNPKEIMRLFHYSNLRALWATENLQKGSFNQKKKCKN
jgi:hypothetical protein